MPDQYVVPTWYACSEGHVVHRNGRELTSVVSDLSCARRFTGEEGECSESEDGELVHHDEIRLENEEEKSCFVMIAEPLARLAVYILQRAG